MKIDPEELAAARAEGDLLREERRAADRSLASQFAASERDFEAMFEVTDEPNLFERALAWFRNLELPVDLLVLDPLAARGPVTVRKLSDDASGGTNLEANAGARVEVAFENHHSEPVWVVTCGQGSDGSVSFVPEKNLSETPCVDPGDALTFSFTPTTETTMRVVAIALRTQPHGDPAEVLAEPLRLQEFGVVATVRFTLRVSPSTT